MRIFVQKIIRHKGKLSFLLLGLVMYYFCLPRTLFNTPTATLITSTENNLLGAKIAPDGQWRFPEADSVPHKFIQCVVYFEDEYFYHHFGFNPVAIGKSLLENIKAGKIVRGGSTLSQQVIRLSRGKKKRSYVEKFVELILATRLELRYSKEDILKLYATHAPFGGNVVGLEAASWRYFRRTPHQLSWAESAVLAVLPNAPGLIYPGKSQQALLKKRNRLLLKLLDHKAIDTLTYKLAIVEPLPGKPLPLPQLAPHLLEYLAKKYRGKRLKTTLKNALQRNVNDIVKRHYERLRQNEVHNAAVLIMEVATRRVIAYIGNTPTDIMHQKDVNMVHAPRSTGSILKPFLYAAMLDAGDLLPNTLVPDIPTQIAGYAPQNFDEQFHGMVPARRALARSLNIPAVRLLQSYGLERFYDQLKQFDLQDINKPPDHYGLSLILGGAESNLWDLCKSYAAMAATIRDFNSTSGEYFDNVMANPVLLTTEAYRSGKKQKEKLCFDAGSMYLTFEAMKDVNRPEGSEAWPFFDSSREIAWKTGTSFGNRDAWAIGVSRDYVVGVWTGNADGEGRPDLTGIKGAAPVLFDVFDVLPRSPWFAVPHDALTQVTTCERSGYLARDICPLKTVQVPNNGLGFASCPFHQLIHLDSEKRYRVNTSCMAQDAMVSVPWFVLPPLVAYYFKTTDPHYKPLPPYWSNCILQTQAAMDFISLEEQGHITLPKGFDGAINPLVVSIAHNRPNCMVFWYLDDHYLGHTQNIHEMALLPKTGQHTITVVDEFGNELRRTIRVMN